MMEHNPLIGKTLAADYKIVSLLGRGGMGSVYLAEQISLKRQVAVKFLPAFDLSEEQFCRFEAEIAAMATLCHPNIVAIHHRGKYGEPPMLYYVMEHLEGGPLKSYLQDHGKLPSYLAVRLIRQVAEALAYAHEQGCIHRDIKPDNLLFNRNYRSLKIADFGIAKMTTGANITQSQGMIGTFLYAAPEQMRWFESVDEQDVEIDERVDQYSLGIVLYEMLSGTLPYRARNFLEMIKSLSEPPIPLSEVAGAGISRSLEWLVQTMTTKAREDRFSSDDELLEAISNVEMESTVSTRIFSVKTEEHLKVTSPGSSTRSHSIQKPQGEFPSHSEKVYMQNLQTADCYAKRYPLPGSDKKFLALIGVAILVIAVIVGYWLLSAKPTPTPPENDKPQPKPEQPQMVAIKIDLRYDVEPPATHPEIQINLLAGQHSKTVSLQDKILPGQYQLSVIFPGYSCLEHGQRLTITQKHQQQLTLTLRALPRKVASDILNAATGQSVRPLQFSLNKYIFTGVKTFKPGDYRLYAQFKEYHDIDTLAKIPPGNDSFQYKTALVPLKQVLFSFRAPDFPEQKQLEVQIDRQKVTPAHLQYQIKNGSVYADLACARQCRKNYVTLGFLLCRAEH